MREPQSAYLSGSDLINILFVIIYLIGGIIGGILSPEEIFEQFGVLGSCWTRTSFPEKASLLLRFGISKVRVVSSVSGSGALLLAASIISADLAREIRGKHSRKTWAESMGGKIARKQTPYLARASGLGFAQHGFGVFGQQQVGAFGRDAIKVCDRRVDFSRLGLQASGVEQREITKRVSDHV